MSVTLESVMKQLGAEAQLTGGRIIVYRDGVHTDVGGISMADAVFSLTDAGKKLLGEDGEPVPAKKAGKKAETKPAEESKDQLDLLDGLDADGVLTNKE
jgi:hypothetical protein